MKHKCLDLAKCEELARTRLTPAEWSRVSANLEGCSECAERAAQISFAATLADGMRSIAATPEPANPALQSLIDRLIAAAPVDTVVPWKQDPGEFGDAPRRTLGQFLVLREIGRGGMGVVFEGEDMQLGRRVALKVMRTRHAASEVARSRFLHEARAVAALKHDNIVSIYQVGEDQGAPFLAMELLEGESLEERLQRKPPPDVREVLRVGRQIALGLHAAHEKGQVHRDIKPSNIWIERHTGRVKILDFGLVRSEQHSESAQEFAGTPGFMAPEQARGEAVDYRCDLFNLGCVLHRMCTGQLPFAGDNPQLWLKALQSERLAPIHSPHATVSPGLVELLTRLLAKDPGERPASAGEVAEMLTQLADRPSAPRRGWVAAGVLILVVAVLLPQVVIRITDSNGSKKEIKTAGKVEIVTENPGAVKVTVIPTATRASVFDGFRRADISAAQFEAVGGGDPIKAPAELVGILQQPGNAQVRALSLHPDGKHLISADVSGQIAVWNLQERKLLATFTRAKNSAINHLSFSTTGQRLAFQWQQGPTVFEAGDAATLIDKPVRHVADFDASSIAISSDGQRLAASSLSGFVRVWALDSREPPLHLTDNLGIYRVVFSPDGKTLATSSAGDDATVKIWDAHDGKLLKTLSGTSSHGMMDVAFSPRGDLLAATQDSRIMIWNLATSKKLTTFENQSRTMVALAFSPDGALIAGAGRGGTFGKLVVWDIMVDKPLLNWDYFQPFCCVLFTPDGRHVLSGADGGGIFVLRLKNF